MSTSLGPLNTLQIDYLRIATHDYQSYLKLVATLRRKYAGWRPAKWLQYKGQKSKNGVFYGVGPQGERSHAIIQVSGNLAQSFYNWAIQKPDVKAGRWYCTRIDLQVTKPHPEGYNPEKAYKRLRGKKSVILSDTGKTLYIGARTSDTFWRIYDKTEDLLRVEVELKGKQAKSAWASLLAGENIGGVWMRVLLRSRVPKVLVDRYKTADEPSEQLPLDIPDEMGKKLEWLKTLDALVYKLANDHDTAEATHVLISRWAEYCSKP